MPVFISYSHTDKSFVDRLALRLVDSSISVWLDRWEMKVGDSLIEQVQGAIESATALLVVLSKSSVESQWCKKELSSGLLRELDERRVVVLPILLEDCVIPLFLRDKVYAVFRTDFDVGINAALEALAGVTSLEMGRVSNDSSFMDWSQDWGERDGLAVFTYTLIQFSPEWRHSILTEVEIVASPKSTQRYRRYDQAGLGWLGRFVPLEAIIDSAESVRMRVVLVDSFPKTQQLAVMDPKTGLGYDVSVRCRRLGEDNGKDILIDCSRTLLTIYDQTKSRMRRPTPEEFKTLLEIVQS